MFKQVIKRVFLGLLATFVAIQFFRPVKNLGASPGASDLMAKYPPPPAVRKILTTSCYDCHSNSTHYPWYAEIQPVGWWLKSHIEDAKDAVNFSEFADYSTKRAKAKLEDCIDEVTDKSMPLPSYLIIHRDARLTPEQAKQLTDWFDSVHDQLEAGS
jgi:hypothetical protein